MYNQNLGGEQQAANLRLQVYKEIMFLGLHTQSHWNRGLYHHNMFMFVGESIHRIQL